MSPRARGESPIRVRVALAQLNPVVGDIDGNATRIARALDDAAAAGADVTLVPELAITGYPPEDLLLRPAFAAAARFDGGRVRVLAMDPPLPPSSVPASAQGARA